MKTKKLWIRVSHDKYELVEAVANSAEELARMCGVTVGTVWKSVRWHKNTHQWTKYREVVVPVEEIDE